MIDETDLLNYNTHTPHQQTKSPTLHVSRTPCVVAERGARTAREGMRLLPGRGAFDGHVLIVLTPSLFPQPSFLSFLSRPSSLVFPRPSSSAFFSFPCTTLLTPSFPSLPCAQEKKRKSPSVGCLLPASPVVAENRQMWCGHTAAPLRGVRWTARYLGSLRRYVSR